LLFVAKKETRLHSPTGSTTTGSENEVPRLSFVRPHWWASIAQVACGA